MGIKVYLAGKVSKNCWRHKFVKGLRDVPAVPNEEWPILEDAIAPGVDYCGPYFAPCDCGHGCNSGECQHGVGTESGCSNSYLNAFNPRGHFYDAIADSKTEVFNQCFEAVKVSDIMIAMPSVDSYGTIVEIGWAYAMSKEVVICHDALRDDSEDFWFVGRCQSSESIYGGMTASYAISEISIRAQKQSEKERMLDLCESPMERVFLTAYLNRNLSNLGDISVAVKVGPYRLDFADVQNKIAVEIDGFDYHSSKEHIIKDRERQRNLEKMGWKIVRFAGSEVHRNVAKCVNDFVQIRNHHLQAVHS